VSGTSASARAKALGAPIEPRAGSPLMGAAGAAFLLLMLALPWTIAPMGIATALCATLTLLVWLTRQGPRWRRTPVDGPTLAWFLALCVVSVFAQDPHASWTRVHKGLFPALVGLAAWHAASRRAGSRAIAWLLISASLAALFGFGLWVAKGASYASRARGLVGHYMTFAGQLVLFTSLAAGVAALARTRAWRRGAALAALLGVLALGATFTRSAWLGLVAALAVVLLATRPRWLIGLAVAVALVLGFGPASVRDRALSAFDPHHPTNRERTYMWEAGLAMFRDHPVTGVGLQDLKPLYDRYKPAAARERAGHLHSVPVHLAATTGIVGLLAFVALFASLLFAAARGLRAQLRTGGLAGGVRLGVTAGLVAFLVAGLFEWNLGDEELLYPLFTLVGIAWAARRWDEP
jgi:O-antigen ligase